MRLNSGLDQKLQKEMAPGGGVLRYARWRVLDLDALGAVDVVALPVGGEALRAGRKSVLKVLSGIEQSDPFGLLTRLVAKLN